MFARGRPTNPARGSLVCARPPHQPRARIPARISQDLFRLVLYMRLLRQVISIVSAHVVAHIDGSLRRPARGWRHHTGATLALTVRGRNVSNAGMGPATDVSRAHPSGPHPLRCRGGGNADLRTPSSLPSLFLGLAFAHTATGMVAWKCVPSFHIRASITASFRATATRARFGPTFFMSCKPQLLSGNRFLTVVNMTLAASYR